MTLDEGIADFHMHTTASDGTVPVAERIEQATDRGLDTIAVTDHDIIPEDVTERSTVKNGVELVAGVEVRANLFDTKIEILGYYVDPSHDGLQELLAQAREFRETRNRRLVENIVAETGLELDYKSLADSVDGNLGRPQIADVLVEKRVVDSISRAFAEYLGDDGRCFVPMERHPADRVIETIHAAGGVASLAHPGRIRAPAETVEKMVETLSRKGLDGVEVAYPYGDVRSEEYAAIDIEDAATFASEYDLLTTGGSDCHGPDSRKFRIGDVRITETELRGVRDRAAEHRR